MKKLYKACCSIAVLMTSAHITDLTKPLPTRRRAEIINTGQLRRSIIHHVSVLLTHGRFRRYRAFTMLSDGSHMPAFLQDQLFSPGTRLQSSNLLRYEVGVAYIQYSSDFRSCIGNTDLEVRAAIGVRLLKKIRNWTSLE